jgi:N-acetylmuramoyl-L-alanine amidase
MSSNPKLFFNEHISHVLNSKSILYDHYTYLPDSIQSSSDQQNANFRHLPTFFCILSLTIIVRVIRGGYLVGKWFILACCAFTLLLFPVQMYALTVVIDPGHGGHDPGAIGVNGLKEKDINLDISNKLRQELIKIGYDVIMTRESDQPLNLQERVAIANQSGGNLFVSVHSNAHTNKSVQGTLVLYYDDRYPQSMYPASTPMKLLTHENQILAQSVQAEIIREVGTLDRGIVPSSVFVVRNGIMPSILIEAAFLSNKQDAALLASDQFRAGVARGIAAGISKYQPPVFYDLSNHWAKEHILKLETLGLVKGDRGAFHPNRQMTRAEYMTVLDNLFSFERLLNNKELEAEQPKEEEMAKDETVQEEEIVHVEVPLQFVDLTEKHWAHSSLLLAAQLGILHGYEDGTIRPDRPISRAEMVVIFDKLALSEIPDDQTDPSLLITFTDVPEQSWYTSSVYKMKQLGYIQGISDDTFAPNRQLMRAEGASMISRYLGSDSGALVLNELEIRTTF